MILQKVLTLSWSLTSGIVDHFAIIVTPKTIMNQNRIPRNYPPYNLSLAHNVKYNVSLVAVNCAGDSIPNALSTMEFSECTYYLHCVTYLLLF